MAEWFNVQFNDVTAPHAKYSYRPNDLAQPTKASKQAIHFVFLQQ